jgi:serine protease AprX
MMKCRMYLALFLTGIIMLVASRSQAQSKYWIKFFDKGISKSAFVAGNPIFEHTRASLTLSCLHRRSLALNEDESSTVTLEDAPICHRYLDSLCGLNIKIIAQSKWSNAVSAFLTAGQIREVSKLGFVREIHPVGTAKMLSVQPTPPSERAVHPVLPNPHPLSSDSGCGYDPIIYQYGDTNIGATNRSDLDRINVWPLHAMGLDGSGVRLGHLDVGCDLAVSSLDSANVLFQYDYVFHDSSVANRQDEHGTETLSTAMGYLPDTLIGPAYHASVMIAHTENTDYEHNIEEDNYAAALEDFEARGVQITTSSLGYFTFDSGQHSYTYADMNGHTAICTQAVERAAKLGVLVVTAMGNSGGDSLHPYVQAPGDADSILACGALDVDDTIVGFSSRGPTSDGRIKPDICAPGVHVWAQGPLGNFGQLNGTSFATPLAAGSCCLIQQAHPDATAQQIRHAVMITGNNAAHPDTAYGWGKLNTYAAALELGTIIHPMQIWTDTALHICAGIASKYPIVNATLTYFGDSDINPRKAPFHLAADSLVYSCTASNSPSAFTDLGQHIYYQISVVDGSGDTTINPRLGWNAFALPATSGVSDAADKNSLSFQIEAYPNPCSSEFELNMSTSGEWQLVNAAGAIVMGDRSQGPSSIRVLTSQLANGAYYLQFIGSSGEARTLPIVIQH